MILDLLHLVSDMSTTYVIEFWVFIFEDSFSDSSLYNQYCCNLVVGSWAKKFLVVVSKKYPAELRAAVPKFLEVCAPTLI